MRNPYFKVTNSTGGGSGSQGPQGVKGEDGYTPIKGVDYFDGEKGPKGDPGDPANTVELTQQVTTISQQLADKADKENIVGGYAEIYGVYQEYSNSSPSLTRTHSSVGKVANVGVDEQAVVNDFNNAQIYRDIKEVKDTYGNTFVRIPKFYIRKFEKDNGLHTQISKKQYKGFYLPKCFWDFTNQNELDYVDVGKYRAGESMDGVKLTSKPDVYPLVSKSIVQLRDLAQANNTDELKGYQQMDIHVQDVLATLFVVEFATLNSQAVMSGFSDGNYSDAHVATLAETQTNRVVMATAYADLFRVGQSIGIGTSRGGNQITSYRQVVAIVKVDENNKAIEFDGAPLNISIGNIVYNTAFKTGFSHNVTASSGSPISNTDGKWGCSYRGIESLWGDIWTFIDGLNINDHQAWVCDDADDYVSNKFITPYKSISYLNVNANGYIKKMGLDEENPSTQLPIDVTASPATWYSDYYYQATGARVALVGGSWSYGVTAGLFYWYGSNSSSAASLSLGGRLLRKPL